MPADSSPGAGAPVPSMLDLVRLSPRRLFPPGGEGDRWTADDNGRYGVRLAEGEIATEDGRLLPPRFLGGFRCRGGLFRFGFFGRGLGLGLFVDRGLGRLLDRRD